MLKAPRQAGGHAEKEVNGFRIQQPPHGDSQVMTAGSVMTLPASSLLT